MNVMATTKFHFHSDPDPDLRIVPEPGAYHGAILRKSGKSYPMTQSPPGNEATTLLCC